MRKQEQKKPQFQEQEASHGFWISVSDLMAGLIFIFLIILTVFSIKYKKEQTEFVIAKAELQSPAKTRLKILKDLKDILRKNGVEVETFPAEGILRLTEKTLRFPAARAVPQTPTLGNLGKLAKALTSVVPCFTSLKNNPFTQVPLNAPPWCQELNRTPDYQCPRAFQGSIETVMVEGHTDSMAVKAGTGYRDNLSLSAARATTVLRLLMQCDPKLGQLYNKKDQPLVGASGYSYLRPVIENHPRDPRNRRIDIRFVMDLPDNALEPDPRQESAKRAPNPGKAVR